MAARIGLSVENVCTDRRTDPGFFEIPVAARKGLANKNAQELTQARSLAEGFAGQDPLQC